MKATLLIKNIGQLITMAGLNRPWLKEDIENLERFEDAVVICKGDEILAAGDKSLMDDYDLSEAEVVDAGGKLVTPGLVDSHVHLIFAGWRENELALKLKGYDYLEILEQGGGILNTVRATREATSKELYEHVYKLLDNMLENGTTTTEAKSGYGLDLETELKSLRLVKELNKDHEIDLVGTFLGTHAVPEEFKDAEEYTNFVIEEVLPKVADEKLAEFCDVFCDQGVFSVDQARRILSAAKEKGMKLKIHADELVALGGAELAAELSATTAEHLLKASDNGIEKMAEAGVIATLLPGTPFYLMLDKYADARKMIDKGLAVSIATDLNPGTSATESLQIIMNLASFMMKMTAEEIIAAVTINPAYGINKGDKIGSLEKGKKADIVIWDSDNLEFLIYHFGVNLANKVFKNGKLVVENGKKINKK